MTIKAIAIDDEPLALEKLKSFVYKTPSIKLLSTFESPLNALAFMKSNPVDLLFLDIQMGELSGLQFMDALTDKPSIIITSAYEKYAIKGYDYDVIDYLLKPFGFERYLQAIDKIKKEDKENIHGREAIFIKSGYQLKRIEVDTILYIKGMSEYLQIVTTEGNILTLSSFPKLLELLPPDSFVRIHKSYMVALNKIHYIDTRVVVLQNREEIPIGKNYKTELNHSIEW